MVPSGIGDVSATVSCYVPALDTCASGNKSVSLSNFVVSADNNRLIEYGSMYSDGDTAEGVVGVSNPKILARLGNRKAC